MRASGSDEKARLTAQFPGLFVLTVGGVDAALQDDFHRVAIHCFRFVLADAAARYDCFNHRIPNFAFLCNVAFRSLSVPAARNCRAVTNLRLPT